MDTAARLDAALNAGGNLVTLVAPKVALPAFAEPETSPAHGGLAFPPDLRHGVDAAAELWRCNLLGPDLLCGAGFTATAFLPPAMRWLTSPLDDIPVGMGERPVGQADIDVIRQASGTLRGLDNHYGGGHIHGTVMRHSTPR
jgi:hypothetical protein